MAPAEVESALKILKGFCFTVKLWNQTKGRGYVLPDLVTSKPVSI